VVVVAHKVVSKAEGRLRRLHEIEPGERARELAERHRKDPRLVQAVLDESAELLRAEDGTLICVTRHGFVCTNAGVDSRMPARPVTSWCCSRRTRTRPRGGCETGSRLREAFARRS